MTIEAKNSARPRRRRIRLGMVGGGEGAFIGGVHRIAARLDDQYELVAGALASSPEKARRSGLALGLAEDRCYADYAAMAKAEAARGDGIEAVAIVTPNHLHAPVAEAFLKAGIHVICDKPLATSVKEARRLEALAAKHRRRVRGHLQLHRLPDGARGAAAGAGRPARRDPRGPGRVRAGLADRIARSQRPEAGRVAHRPGALGRGRLHRRHRHACVPARRLRRRARRSASSAPSSAPSSPAAASTTTCRCCCASPAARAARSGRARSRPATRTTCACASTAAAPGSSGARSSRTSSAGRRSASRRRRSRAPAAPPAPRRRGCRAFRPAIPRATSRRSPRSTARSRRRSAPPAAGRRRPIRRSSFPGSTMAAAGVEFIEAAVASSRPRRSLGAPRPLGRRPPPLKP